MTLSVSAILSGASAFLLGFHISQKSTGVTRKGNAYRNIIIVLAIPTLIIGISSLCTVVNSTLVNSTLASDDYALLIISIIGSLVPPITFLIMALK